jgi:thiamine biosynthesis protein ThiI
MELPGADTVVLRYGEIGTKSRQVRGHFEERLAENVEALLADRSIPGDVEVRPTRLRIETTEDAVDRATEAATDAMGVVTASPARRLPSDRERVEAALVEAALATYDGGSFAVRPRRSGDAVPYTSEQLGRSGGAAIFEALESEGWTPTVDLDDPDHEYHAEVRAEEAFVYLEKRTGPGGLPLGTQDRVVALTSGGIDSPVAAHETMRRGCPVVPLYFDLGDYGGPDHEARALETARRLAAYAPNFDTRVRRVPAGEHVDYLVEEMDRGRMLSLRRFMFRVAEHVAADLDASGIVTGEVVGQKSSQTGRNLKLTSAAVDLPVHRPLLTVDKSEIADRARDIGTFDDSTIPAGCNRVAPDSPETNGRLDRLRAVEPADLFDRAREAARRVEVMAPESDRTVASTERR